MSNFASAMNTEFLNYLSLDIHPLAWAMLIPTAICGILFCTLLCRRLSAIRAKVETDDSQPIPETGYPSVSIIVCAQSNGKNLPVLLREILEQDYPGDVEIIVVNDEHDVATEDAISLLERQYHNIYMTFAPEKTRALSRKKLSITLGMKAARNEYVLLTSGNCRISSNIWLKLMMRHTIAGADIVLGRSRLSVITASDTIEPAHLSATHRFSRQWDLVRWLGSATRSHAFMGDGNNLVYKRELFFENKGFSNTLNLRNGDDDVFISQIAKGRNVALELSPDACVMDVDTMPDYIHSVMKRRRMFTAKYLPQAAFRYMGSIELLNWLTLALGIAAAIIAFPSPVVAAAAFVILLAGWIPAMFAWRKCGRSLQQFRPACFRAPFLMLRLPFYNLRYRLQLKKEIPDHLTYHL